MTDDARVGRPEGQMLVDAVVVVIRDGDRLLFIQRAVGTPAAGYWAPVTGKIEPGESEAATVAREALEEVGLEVIPVRKVWEHPSDVAGYRLHWWLADCQGGELTLAPREVAAARWVTLAEIATLTPTFEHDRVFFATVFPAVAGLKHQEPGSASGRTREPLRPKGGHREAEPRKER